MKYRVHYLRVIIDRALKWAVFIFLFYLITLGLSKAEPQPHINY